MSASVKAYYAFKLSGMNEKSLVLSKAKKCIIEKGGANSVNVFTKISLALFNQITWRSIPFMPVEIIKFPKWFPFNIYKISYWSRTVLIPLLIIMYEKPIASNPNAIDIDELFTSKTIKAKSDKSLSQRLLSVLFLFLETLSRLLFPLLPKSMKAESKKEIIKHHLDPIVMYNKWTPDKANLTQAPWLETIDFVVFKDKREKRRLLSRIDIDKVQLEDIEIDYIIDFLNTLTDKNGNNRPIGRPESVPSGFPVD